MNSCEDDFGEAGIPQPINLLPEVLQLSGTDRTPDGRNNAVGTAVIAALLNFHSSPCFSRGFRDIQRFEGHPGKQRRYGAKRFSFPNHLFQQPDDIPPELSSENQIGVCFRLELAALLLRWAVTMEGVEAALSVS